MNLSILKFIKFASAAVLAVMIGPLSASNVNTTIQEGRVNINRTFQCGASNDNATYQSGEININRTIQVCRGKNSNRTGQFGHVNYNSTHQGRYSKLGGKRKRSHKRNSGNIRSIYRSRDDDSDDD